MISLFTKCKDNPKLPECNKLYQLYVYKCDNKHEHKVIIVKPDMMQSFKPHTDLSTLIDTTSDILNRLKSRLQQ